MAGVGSALVALAATPVQSQSSNLDFSGLSYPELGCQWSGVDNLNAGGGYGGLSWTNLFSLDLANYFGKCYTQNKAYMESVRPTGYPVGGVTNPGDVTGTVGLGFGEASFQATGSPFVLTGGEFGAGWNPFVQLTVTGYLGGVQQYSDIFEVGTTGPTTRAFARMLVDEVKIGVDFNPNNLGIEGNDPFDSRFEFIPREGEDPYYSTYYIKNLQFGTVVPEPSTVLLLAAGLAGLGIAARRRRSAR